MKSSNSSSFGIKIKEKLNLNKNFLTLDNDSNQKNNDPYEILSEKIDSTKTKTPKLITTVDNINQIRKKKYIFKHPKIKLPLIKARQLLTEADLIVKKGKKMEGLTPVYTPVDIKIKKSVEINLNNKLIKNIIQIRQKIKEDEKIFIDKINKRNEEYNKEYKKYLNLVEMGQKKQKEEDDINSALKKEMKNKENILINEIAKNKVLNLNMKKLVNELLIYKKYGQFIHKIFGNKFIFNSLKEFDGKNYDKIKEDIINIYENNIEDDIFYEMLKSQGLYYFFLKWENMESNIRNQLDKNNEIKEELNELNSNKKNEINILNKEIIKSNVDKKYYDKNKKEESQIVKEYRDYYNNINDAKHYIKYVIELNNLLSEGIKVADLTYDINNIEEEDYLSICEDAIKYLEQKEKIVNKYINQINDIFNCGNKENIQLIEKIINNRKKLNIRVKQLEFNKLQEKNKRKNAFKSLNSQKIVLKGRKVPKKYPFFKKDNKNDNKIISSNENLISEYHDYICYSEDDD